MSRTPAKVTLELRENILVSTLLFHTSTATEWYERLQTSLRKKAWEKKDTAQSQTSFSTKGAGITGLIRKQEEEHSSSKQLAETAFSDLKTLMSKAEEVVGLMERYSSSKSKGCDVGVSSADGEDQALSELVLQLGISNPVSHPSLQLI